MMAMENCICHFKREKTLVSLNLMDLFLNWFYSTKGCSPTKRQDEIFTGKLLLKLVSAIFYQICIFSPNHSPLKTMKNNFYFI